MKIARIENVTKEEFEKIVNTFTMDVPSRVAQVIKYKCKNGTHISYAAENKVLWIYYDDYKEETAQEMVHYIKTKIQRAYQLLILSHSEFKRLLEVLPEDGKEETPDRYKYQYANDKSEYLSMVILNKNEKQVLLTLSIKNIDEMNRFLSLVYKYIESIEEWSKPHNFVKAQVGDRVWSFYSGWGNIESINLMDMENKPLHVVFDNGDSDLYTFEGQEYDSDDSPQSLFWGKIEFNVPQRPVEPVEKLYKVRINHSAEVMAFDGKKAIEKVMKSILDGEPVHNWSSGTLVDDKVGENELSDEIIFEALITLKEMKGENL